MSRCPPVPQSLKGLGTFRDIWGQKDNKTTAIMYHLEKYHTKASRHECPNCHDRHSFTYYVDDNGEPLDLACGRCDHESRCGYHYTPKQYFIDHPALTATARPFIPKMQTIARPPLPLCTLPFRYVRLSASYNSTFVRFLCSLFDRHTLDSPTIRRLGELYALGATNDKDVIFWQIDSRGRVRSGKIMRYGTDGHRIKDNSGGADWVHAKLMKAGRLPPDWQLTQCFFGEHLLNWSMNRDKVVALVESEKSALIAAACFPNYVWLATGGKSQLSADKMKALAGRTVILFPDVDGYSEWKEKAKELIYCKVTVSDILERNATDDERAAKIDIADWLVRQLRDRDTETSSIVDFIAE